MSPILLLAQVANRAASLVASRCSPWLNPLCPSGLLPVSPTMPRFSRPLSANRVQSRLLTAGGIIRSQAHDIRRCSVWFGQFRDRTPTPCRMRQESRKSGVPAASGGRVTEKNTRRVALWKDRRSWRMLPAAWTRAVIFKAASCAGVRLGGASGARVSAGSLNPPARFIEYNCVLCSGRRRRCHADCSGSPAGRRPPVACQSARQLVGIRHARRSFGARDEYCLEFIPFKRHPLETVLQFMLNKGSGQTAELKSDHGDVDEFLRAGNCPLVVTHQPALVHQPAEYAFNTQRRGSTLNPRTSCDCLTLWTSSLRRRALTQLANALPPQISSLKRLQGQRQTITNRWGDPEKPRAV